MGDPWVLIVMIMMGCLLGNFSGGYWIISILSFQALPLTSYILLPLHSWNCNGKKSLIIALSLPFSLAFSMRFDPFDADSIHSIINEIKCQVNRINRLLWYSTNNLLEWNICLRSACIIGSLARGPSDGLFAFFTENKSKQLSTGLFITRSSYPPPHTAVFFFYFYFGRLSENS